jgi:nucleoside-diphosphate-sugar epimerase
VNHLAIVTGSPGWLGTRLVECLLDGLPGVPALTSAPEGRRVRLLVRSGTPKSEIDALHPRAEIVTGDVADPESVAALLDGAEGGTVFHGAGVIHPSAGIRELYRTNAVGTRTLLDEARRRKVRRFIFVSSNSPIGCNPGPDHVFDEDAPYNPYMAYGRSKHQGELAVREANSPDFETVIIRPPWFYGPNQPSRQSLFFSMIREGKVPLVGDGKNRRSMAYIDNIVQGLLLCERAAEIGGRVYWIADARPYEMNEILGTIEDVLEKDFSIPVARKRRRLPSVASDVAYAVDGLLQAVGTYNQKIHVLSEMNKTIACSVARAERELGYHPTIALREGMRRSVESLLQRGVTI